jgi:hypothetical protein
VHATDNAPHHASGPLATVTGRNHEGVLWAVGTALAAVVLMFCYLRIAGATQVNSDGAGMAVEASSMLHGNLLLHGWWAADVSFYTTELPEYMLVVAFAGVRPEVIHICAALTYTLLVLLAAYVARGRARGAAGVVRALIAAGVMLAPQPVGPTVVLLGNPDHLGTAVPVLLLLLLLEMAPPRWYVPVGAAVLLAWSIVGDPLVEVVGVLPLGLAGLLWAWRARPSRRGNGAGSGPSARWYVSLAVAAAAAVPLAAVGNQLIGALGGFAEANAWYGVVTWPVFVRGLPWAWQSVLALFGADYAGVSGGANVAFAFAHLIGVAIVAAGLVAGGWRLIRPPRAATAASGGASAGTAARPGSRIARTPGDLIAGVLVLAILANFAAFFITIKVGGVFAAHEIGPVLSLGAALAGRMLGEPLLRAGRGLAWPRRRRRPGRDSPRPVRRGLVLVLAAGLAAYALMLGVAATYTQAVPENVGLAAWLARHDLRSGLSPYWEASSVTVDSAGQITMLSVVPLGLHGHLVPQQWLTDVELGDPKGHTANFIVLSPAETVSSKSALATFGRPAKIYHYAEDTILVWHKNLILQLGSLYRRVG